MQTAFHKSVQDFIVNAFSVSVVRKMGPPGTLESVREFLKSLDLPLSAILTRRSFAIRSMT
jgi:hypothetical protein